MVCKTCYKNNKQNLKYVKLTAKKAGAIPWDVVLVYLIGPYKIIREGHYENLIIEALTIIYQTTGWLKRI